MNNNTISKLDRTIIEMKKLLLKNEDLRKLLYYNTPDALSKATPTKAQVEELILTTPTVYMDENPDGLDKNTFCVIYIPLLDFTADLNDITIIVDAFTRKELLNLDDSKTRLHQLIAEIYGTLDNKRVSLAGRVHFSNASYVNMGNRFIGFQNELSVIDEPIENEIQ